MTEYERALLVGHYLSFSVNNDIDPRLLKRGFTEQQLQQLRQTMGSNSVVGLNLKFTRSLAEYRHPNFNFIYTIYDAWSKHGCLPFGGSFSEQPNKAIEHFSILDELKFEADQKAHAKAQREAKAKKK